MCGGGRRVRAGTAARSSFAVDASMDEWMMGGCCVGKGAGARRSFGRPVFSLPDAR